MKIFNKKLVILFFSFWAAFLVACSSANPKNSIIIYGTPSYSLSPLIDIQTILGGSKDENIVEILTCDDYIYVIGETNSNDGNFSSSPGGQKLFLAVIDSKGQLKKSLVFGVSNIKNTFIKAKNINNSVYILSDCSLDTQSVAVYKIIPKTNEIYHTITESVLIDENGLDLIEWKESIYIIGQSYDYATSCKSLFITRFDHNLNKKHYERILRPADLTYIGTESSSDFLKVWVNAIAITYSYPAMIDISKDNYVYNNFQNELYAYRLLDVASVNNNALLILSNENRNNAAAFVYYSSLGFSKVNHIAIDNVNNAKIITDENYALVYFGGNTPIYYIIYQNMNYPISTLNKTLLAPYKFLNIKKGVLILSKESNQKQLLYLRNQKINIADLSIIKDINAFCIFNDYFISACNYQNKNSKDIKVHFSKIMPYYFNKKSIS